jgi:Mg2+ and Co2+ transporter CorA
MIDAGGNARGRIWLPTDLAQTDSNGNRWFTHEIQVIADGPSPGSFVWAWEDKGGPPYAPRPCQHTAGGGTGAPGPDVPATGGGGAGPTSPGDMLIDLRPLEARIQKLERLVAAQADAIADLQKRPVTPPSPDGGAVPKKIALKTDHGTYVTAETDGRMTNREDHPGSWQTFKVEGMDY